MSLVEPLFSHKNQINFAIQQVIDSITEYKLNKNCYLV